MNFFKKLIPYAFELKILILNNGSKFFKNPTTYKHLIQNIKFLRTPFSAQFCLTNYHKSLYVTKPQLLCVWIHIDVLNCGVFSFFQKIKVQ